MSEPNFTQLERDLAAAVKIASAALTDMRQYVVELEDAASVTPRELSNLRTDNDRQAAYISNLETRLAVTVRRAEAAEANARELEKLAREYSALEEYTQKHAQAMEAAMLRWQQRAAVLR